MMEKVKTVFKNAWPYQKDKMNLPVKDVESAIAYYEKILDFRVVSQKDLPYKRVIFERDDIQIGLAENGGDPGEDGCFFEVDNIEVAFTELRLNGLDKEVPGFKTEKHGDTSWKVFYVIAPDGLCYCVGEKCY